MVIISAGYDSAVGDPEVCISVYFSYAYTLEHKLQGKMEVTPVCYSHFVLLLSFLANGKIAVVLESEYCLQSLVGGAALTLKTLLGDPYSTMIEPSQPSSPRVIETILNSTYSIRPY